jgi:hypothetical protein
MADTKRLESALRNAAKAGDDKAARKLANEIKAIRASDGGSSERSIIDTFNDYSDAAGTVLSNIGGSIAGSTYGLAKGLYNAVDEGTYGTREGVQTVRNTMDQVSDQFSKGQAYTSGGQGVLDSAAEAIAPIADAVAGFEQDARVLEPLAMMAGSPLAPAARSLAISQGAPVAAREALRQTGQAVTAPQRAAAEGYRRLTSPPANNRSMGAAETDKARERLTTAQGLPVPFEGDSGLTRGQATRDAQQLKFETEAARDGSPDMQDRRRNQQAVAGQNFDRMEEDIDAPAFGSLEEQGQAVRNSLLEYKASRKREMDGAYQEARDAGEMSALVDPAVLAEAGLTEIFQTSWIRRGINPMNEPVYQEAKRLNIIDDQGRLKATSADMLETFRQFVNDAYDVTIPKEARQRRQFINAIDKGMDSVDSGPAYRNARSIASNYYDEFDSSPLARDLDGSQRRSNTPKVADENISKKIAGSSNTQIRQIKDTLNATPEGQATWRSVQTEFLRDIRNSAFGTQTSDLSGTPLLTAGKFKNKVADLDRSGRLETILGPQQAQYIRDLVEVTDMVATMPPQAVNPGTAAELMRRLKGLVPAKAVGGAGLAEAAMTGGVPIFSMLGQGASMAAQAAKVKKSLDGAGLLTEGMK